VSGTDKATPQQVFNITSGVGQISSGGYHSCVRTTAGGIKCWGANSFGQVGAGVTTTNYASYWDVAGLSTSANIAAGEEYSCSITTSNTMQCWGKRILGQFGDGAIAGAPAVVAGGLTLF